MSQGETLTIPDMRATWPTCRGLPFQQNDVASAASYLATTNPDVAASSSSNHSPSELAPTTTTTTTTPAASAMSKPPLSVPPTAVLSLSHAAFYQQQQQQQQRQRQLAPGGATLKRQLVGARSVEPPMPPPGRERMPPQPRAARGPNNVSSGPCSPGAEAAATAAATETRSLASPSATAAVSSSAARMIPSGTPQAPVDLATASSSGGVDGADDESDDDDKLPPTIPVVARSPPPEIGAPPLPPRTNRARVEQRHPRLEQISTTGETERPYLRVSSLFGSQRKVKLGSALARAGCRRQLLSAANSTTSSTTHNAASASKHHHQLRRGGGPLGKLAKSQGFDEKSSSRRAAENGQLSGEAATTSQEEEEDAAASSRLLLKFRVPIEDRPKDTCSSCPDSAGDRDSEADLSPKARDLLLPDNVPLAPGGNGHDEETGSTPARRDEVLESPDRAAYDRDTRDERRLASKTSSGLSMLYDVATSELTNDRAHPLANHRLDGSTRRPRMTFGRCPSDMPATNSFQRHIQEVAAQRLAAAHGVSSISQLRNVACLPGSQSPFAETRDDSRSRAASILAHAARRASVAIERATHMDERDAEMAAQAARRARTSLAEDIAALAAAVSGNTGELPSSQVIASNLRDAVDYSRSIPDQNTENAEKRSEQWSAATDEIAALMGVFVRASEQPELAASTMDPERLPELPPVSPHSSSSSRPGREARLVMPCAPAPPPGQVRVRITRPKPRPNSRKPSRPLPEDRPRYRPKNNTLDNDANYGSGDDVEATRATKIRRLSRREPSLSNEGSDDGAADDDDSAPDNMPSPPPLRALRDEHAERRADGDAPVSERLRRRASSSRFNYGSSDHVTFVDGFAITAFAPVKGTAPPIAVPSEHTPCSPHCIFGETLSNDNDRRR